MRTAHTPYLIIRLFIAIVWLINGLFCKVLNLVPRHQQIVEEILHTPHGRLLTVLIGTAECIMTVWILSNYKSKLSAVLQMAVVAVMNVLELLFVPHLLLWGKMNMIYAFIFIVLIYFNEFKLKPSDG